MNLFLLFCFIFALITFTFQLSKSRSTVYIIYSNVYSKECLVYEPSGNDMTDLCHDDMLTALEFIDFHPRRIPPFICSLLNAAG